MKALILLSTYNGEKYLAAQLDSLIAQTHTDWHLLIRDDGSTDSTLAIINRYTEADPRIQFCPDMLGNQRIIKSYSLLMEQAKLRDEEVVFFTDQDDIWLAHKIAVTITELIRLRELHGGDKPLLVHTDLSVVDVDLQQIHPSFIAYEGLTRNVDQPLQTLLMNNYVTGCTMAINRPLLQIATPIPPDVFMHDWWCALCAATFGYIGFVDEATILYRQHGGNSIGASGQKNKLKELKQVKPAVIRRLKNLRQCIKQATSLFAITPRDNPHYQLVSRFSRLASMSLFQRYKHVNALPLQFASPLRAVIFYVFVMIA